jgi:HAE1 family hydrophobic/amphiphilic exporter-1
MNAYLDQEGLPAGIESRQGGIIELIGDSLGPVGAALAIGVFLVYTVMAFNSSVSPTVIVMVSIPFCLIGVVGGLLAFGSTISLLAVTGVIALGGIVVNNAIILIDYINLLRSATLAGLACSSPSARVVRTLRQVYRRRGVMPHQAILMTTLTTIFGVSR